MTAGVFNFRKAKKFIERRWKDVRVGDFVKVICNEIVPADLLLLHTSDPKGVCHIETSNLDGETNLKQRRVMSGVCISVRNTYYLFHFSPVFLLLLCGCLAFLLLSVVNTCQQTTVTFPDYLLDVGN